MASITLAGTLLDPNSDLSVGDEIRFTHQSTTGQTVKSAVSLVSIPPNGTYSVPLQYGLVLVEYKDIRSTHFKNLGIVTVNGSTTATSIPEILNSAVPVTNPVILEMEALITDARDSYKNGVLTFSTYALLTAFTPATLDHQLSSFKVTNDSNTSLNGYYSWVSGTTYTKDSDLVVGVIDENNTSDGVSGKAVYDGIFIKGNYAGAASGEYFPFKNTYMRNNGIYGTLTGYQASYYIPLLQTDGMEIRGMVKGGSFAHLTFFTVNKTFISTYSVGSTDPVINLVSADIPATTAFVVINSSDAKEADQSVIKNGIENFTDSIISNQSRLSSLETFAPVGSGIVDGAYKGYLDNYYLDSTTGKISPLIGFSITYSIPLTDSDTLRAENTAKSGSIANVNFLDKDKVFISSLFFASVPNIVELDSNNIPATAEYVVLSHITGTPVYATINGVETVLNRLTSLESTNNLIESNALKISGDYFTITGYRNNTTGALVSHAAFKTTELLPFTTTDYMYAFGTIKSGSLSNVNFYDSNKAFLGVYNLAGSNPKLDIDPLWNNLALANTAYITLNNYPAGSPRTEVVINGVSSNFDMSQRLVRNYLFDKKFTFFGDSITALTTWEQMVTRLTSLNATIRGIGSSAMALAGPTQVAIQPDGMYINRRSNYNTDTEYTNALAAQGYTNLVTTPTWINYSNNPSGYTLPAASYFDIVSQATEQERINTLPIDSQVVSVLFGTNDSKTNLGTIDSYNDGTFIGDYRFCLDAISVRCPDAVIVVCIPTRNTLEYDNSTNARTTYGTGFDDMRELLRGMCNAYGFYTVDFSTIINHKNAATYLSDGIHPNTNGQILMSKKYALEVSRLAISD